MMKRFAKKQTIVRKKDKTFYKAIVKRAIYIISKKKDIELYFNYRSYRSLKKCHIVH